MYEDLKKSTTKAEIGHPIASGMAYFAQRQRHACIIAFVSK